MSVRAAARYGGFSIIETLVVGNNQSASPTFITTLSLGPLAFSREQKLDGRLHNTHASYTDRLIAFLKLFCSIIFSFSTWNH